MGRKGLGVVQTKGGRGRKVRARKQKESLEPEGELETKAEIGDNETA